MTSVSANRRKPRPDTQLYDFCTTQSSYENGTLLLYQVLAQCNAHPWVSLYFLLYISLFDIQTTIQVKGKINY